VPHGTWIVGCLIARAFARDGWSPRLIDEEGGVAIDDASAVDIWLSDAQLIDLGRYGLLPLTTTADGGGIAAFSVGTVHRPMVFEDAMASADAQIAASLPCILSVARLVHTIKVQIRNKQLVFVERSDVVSWLNRWLARYVSRGDGQAPLVEARLTIEMDLANYQVFPVTIDLWPRLDDSPISRPLRVVTEAYNSRQ
jgi:type VI secretion system protein ImpC